MDGQSCWGTDQTGILVLPSGRRVRGRGLGRPTPPGAPPQFGLYLPMTRLYSTNAANIFGWGVAVGDINGDGLQDIYGLVFNNALTSNPHDVVFVSTGGLQYARRPARGRSTGIGCDGAGREPVPTAVSARSLFLDC